MTTSVRNDQYTKHVGYSDTNAAIGGYFSMDTASFIAAKCGELLSDTFPQGVVVPIPSVVDVMNNVYEGYRPATGDIYSRYTIPSAENPNCVDEMINQCVQVIVTQVKDNLEMDARNAQLNNWVVMYGSFNEAGLRAHAPIKVRERRPQPLMINMNY
jgi:hypothetical protein